MSRKVSLNSLTEKDRMEITRELQIKVDPPKFNRFAKPKLLCLFDVENDFVYLPFSYQDKFPRPERKTLPSSKLTFQGELRPPQQIVKNEAISSLNKKGSVIIAAYPSFGKTCIGVNIACKIGLKTLIICHRLVLINQWQESIEKFCDGKVQIVSPKDKLDPSCDFYIMNAINIPKKSRKEYQNIGFVICDEIHLLMAERLSECMRHLTPRYLLGLSATPYREDGLDVLLDMYCGKDKIERKLYRKHKVYKITTGIKPEVKMNVMGKIDWSSVIDSLSNNIERNEMIINLIKKNKDRVFLVLCKRVSQAEYLVERLKEDNEDVSSLIGKNQEYKKDCRILIGTSGKLSTGFDNPRLNTLLLATDIEQYFIQVLGRIFRAQDTEPVIFDIVDNHPILTKHFRTRSQVYLEHGGVVQDVPTLLKIEDRKEEKED